MHAAVLELGASPERDGRTGDSWTPVLIVSPSVHQICHGARSAFGVASPCPELRELRLRRDGDGNNGRLSRLLSTRLLSEVGYGVGRYVSLEGLVYERRDAYYDALAASTTGWQDGAHDPWLSLRCFVEVVAEAYETFAKRAADHRSGMTKQDRVRNYVLNHAGASFEMADIRRAMPGVSDHTIRLVLRESKDGGFVNPSGVGRGTK